MTNTNVLRKHYFLQETVDIPVSYTHLPSASAEEKLIFMCGLNPSE